MENRLTIKQKLLIGSLVVYLFSLFVFIESADTYIYSKIAFLCTFILAIINIRKENIYLTNIDIAFVLFVFMCSLSCLWSRWQAKSIETSITMLQLMLMFCVLRMALRAFADSKLFENIIIISGLGMCVFYLYEYGISGYLSALNGIGRIGSEYENTNTIGGSGAFILVVSLLTGMNERKWYYFIVSFFAGFIVLGSGSKTAILISILGSLVAILVAKKKRKGSKLSKLLFIVYHAIFRKKRVWIAALALSVTIELIQYFTGWGIAELDDLFGNTLGGVIGVWGGVAMGYVQMAKYVERKNG